MPVVKKKLSLCRSNAMGSVQGKDRILDQSSELRPLHLTSEQSIKYLKVNFIGR